MFRFALGAVLALMVSEAAAENEPLLERIRALEARVARLEAGRTNADDFDALLKKARAGDTAARAKLAAMRRRIDRALADPQLEAKRAEAERRIKDLESRVKSAEKTPTADQRAWIHRLEKATAAPAERYRAAVQLGEVRHADALRALMRALRLDTSPLVRRASAYSLGKLGTYAESAIPGLIHGITDDDEYVGYMCNRALHEILGRKSPSIAFDPTWTHERRVGVSAAWKTWWDEHNKKQEKVK
ncbi:MAG: HEAT repeat domain-containing protein [Planctomycetota bacterium]|nr:HEAT repeat domain-containing protein [Planctomycetota bacterium]